MNPFPIVIAMLRKSPWMTFAFVLLVALATALGVAMTTQEKALKRGSAKAADPFEMIVAAPASQTDVLFKTVFLRPGTVELLNQKTVAQVLSDRNVAYAAPLGFGDNHDGDPVIGTTSDLVLSVSGGALQEGRMFATWEEAIVGSQSPLKIGDKFKSEHGHDEDSASMTEAEGDNHEHDEELTVVGRMAPTGSPWDRAIVLPIEKMWTTHFLPPGHDKAAGEILGPPFDPAFVSPVPAIIVKAKSIADAYGLRSEFRTSQSTAFFPAEVLIELYDLMGNIRVMMSALAVGTQILVIAAILTAIVILLRLQRKQFAILRALGAPRTYVLAAVWLYIVITVTMGAFGGVLLGWVLSFGVSQFVAESTGVALLPVLGWSEVGMAFSVVLAGSLLAIVPALMHYRAPVADALRAD
jgi:putative ABC transport system permease protein